MLKATITLHPAQVTGPVHRDIYGQFIEHAYRCIYGGFWAEMLSSRKFEADDGEGERYGVVKPWLAVGRTAGTHFMHDNSVYYTGSQSQKIISHEKPEHRTGIKQENLFLEKGTEYELRLNLKQEGITGPLRVALAGQGRELDFREIQLEGAAWERFSFSLTPDVSDSEGFMAITFQGSGMLWLGTASLVKAGHLSGFRKDVVEAVKAIKPPTIRWPGGNMVSFYHWEDGIGDRDLRPARINRAYAGAVGEEWEAGRPWEPNDVGVDEFMTLCELTGARPFVVVNSGDGTPDKAANLVEYCNGLPDTPYGSQRAQNGHPEPYNVQLWGIGNEMFGNWQNGHVDEVSYARRHRAFAEAMRAVDPNIELIATGGRYWFYPGWNQALFDLAGNHFNHLSLHSYTKKYRGWMKKEDLQDPKFAKEFYYYIVSSPYGIEEQIALTGQEIAAAYPEGDRPLVAFDEWNCWAYRAPRFETEHSLRDGLYTAGVLHAFMRQHQVLRIASFSMTVNCLPMIRVRADRLFLNPQYLVFKMYQENQGNHQVTWHLECPTYPAPEYEAGRPQAIGDIPYLDVAASISGDERKLFLAVVNRNDIEEVQTDIVVEGWETSPEGRIVQLSSESYMDENSFEEPDRLQITETASGAFGDGMSFTFPRHSVTILAFNRR